MNEQKNDILISRFYQHSWCQVLWFKKLLSRRRPVERQQRSILTVPYKKSLKKELPSYKVPIPSFFFMIHTLWFFSSTPNVALWSVSLKGNQIPYPHLGGKKNIKSYYMLCCLKLLHVFFIKSVDVCHFEDLPCFSFVLFDFIIFFNFDNYVSLISAALCGTLKDIRV